MEQDTKYIKNYVEELEKENKVLKKIVNAIRISGPDDDAKKSMWIELDHEELPASCAFRHGGESMVGNVVYEFGKILQDAKANFRL